MTEEKVEYKFEDKCENIFVGIRNIRKCWDDINVALQLLYYIAPEMEGILYDKCIYKDFNINFYETLKNNAGNKYDLYRQNENHSSILSDWARKLSVNSGYFSNNCGQITQEFYEYCDRDVSKTLDLLNEFYLIKKDDIHRVLDKNVNFINRFLLELRFLCVNMNIIANKLDIPVGNRAYCDDVIRYIRTLPTEFKLNPRLLDMLGGIIDCLFSNNDNIFNELFGLRDVFTRTCISCNDVHKFELSFTSLMHIYYYYTKLSSNLCQELDDLYCFDDTRSYTKCEICGAATDRLKYISFNPAPKVLMFALDGFNFSNKWASKVDDLTFKFPLILDLERYSEKNVKHRSCTNADKYEYSDARILYKIVTYCVYKKWNINRKIIIKDTLLLIIHHCIDMDLNVFIPSRYNMHSNNLYMLHAITLKHKEWIKRKHNYYSQRSQFEIYINDSNDNVWTQNITEQLQNGKTLPQIINQPFIINHSKWYSILYGDTTSISIFEIPKLYSLLNGNNKIAVGLVYRHFNSILYKRPIITNKEIFQFFQCNRHIKQYNTYKYNIQTQNIINLNHQ